MMETIKLDNSRDKLIFNEGTYLIIDHDKYAVVEARTLCPDGKVRAVRFYRPTGMSLNNIPGQIRVRVGEETTTVTGTMNVINNVLQFKPNITGINFTAFDELVEIRERKKEMRREERMKRAINADKTS